MKMLFINSIILILVSMRSFAMPNCGLVVDKKDSLLGQNISARQLTLQKSSAGQWLYSTEIKDIVAAFLFKDASDQKAEELIPTELIIYERVNGKPSLISQLNITKDDWQKYLKSQKVNFFNLDNTNLHLSIDCN